ncbi:hypothetical protein Tco_0999442 [Tanacetum coccineum]|uniref:Uncharacterized protein n=1 Tax=Tanacetum coccineum TaxID=301880 RepID=A0ABQ4WTN9_9ASTR
MFSVDQEIGFGTKCTYYYKILDEVAMDRMMLEKRKIVEEGEVERIIEDEFPKKLDDSGCFLVTIQNNGRVTMVIDDNVVKHVNHAKKKGKDVDDEGSDEED